MKHRTEVLWERGGFEGSLAFNWQSGYVDAAPVKTINGVVTNFNVRPYETWDVGISYKGIKNLSLRVGVQNLLDRAPPYSRQGKYFQVGYDPTYVDPRGRTFVLNATYGWK